MITVTRYHDISCGHRVCEHESRCRQLHGHNYRIHFTCRGGNGGLDSIGRVIDFSEIKNRLCTWLEAEWDHRMLLWHNDPWLSAVLSIDPTVVPVPFNPTAENMALYLLRTVGPSVLEGTGISLVNVRIEETRKCSAEVAR
jgi:6-pyruvoyltetrahydropterin/6-carboxytetrahydropterin synthase